MTAKPNTSPESKQQAAAPGSQAPSAKLSQSLSAFTQEILAAKTPYQRIAAIKREGARRRYAGLITIRTVEEALEWGDSWRAAYHELYAQAIRESTILQDRVLDLETDLQIERCSRLLEKHGIT